jgi:hypothetical protein
MHRYAARDPATRSALFSSSHLTTPPHKTTPQDHPTESRGDFAGTPDRRAISQGPRIAGRFRREPGSPGDFAESPASSIPSGMAFSSLHLTYPAAARDEQHRSVLS